MNIDFEVLTEMGTTNDRWKELCTASRCDPVIWDKLSKEEQAKIDLDIERRTKLEDRISNRLTEHINFSLKNQHLYGAVDLAWDSKPINKETYPLLMYAQGLLDVPTCADSMSTLSCAADYVKLDEKGRAIGIDLPTFLDVEVNLIRHMVTRRLAAQSAKYYSLYPHYKFEPVGTSPEDKLYADVWSQKMDQMTDQLDYRNHDMQVLRDVLLYGHSVDFVRSAWMRDCHIRKKTPPPGIDGDAGNETVVAREGVLFDNPHPTRLFYDISYPLSSLNADVGCEYCGYWDIKPYRFAAQNTDFFNRSDIGFSTGFTTLFATYSTYFTQYYDRIRSPNADRMLTASPELENDRQSNISRYASGDMDAAMLLSVYFEKLVPSEWGIGTYPFPVWVKFIWAGTCIVHVEMLPSTPAMYCGLNENDSRRVNLSFAMELMPYQDQLTNLLNVLLTVCRGDQVKIYMVNKDTLDAPAQKKLEAELTGKTYLNRPLVVFYSSENWQEMGFSPKDSLHVVQPTSNAQSITFIFQAITQLIALVERLTAMSPNEVGQPIVRGNGGVTATEAAQVQSTTNTVEAFISDAFDSFRAAKKKAIYESYLSLGSDEIQAPVINRYPKSVIEKAGFRVVSDEGSGSESQRYVIVGPKKRMPYSLVFSTRDGSERENNPQTATTLMQLMPLLANPVLAQKVPASKFYEIMNEIFRKSGSGVDLMLEAEPGNDGPLVPPQDDLMEIAERLTGLIENNTQEIQQIKQFLASLGGQRNPQQQPTQAPQAPQNF